MGEMVTPTIAEHVIVSSGCCSDSMGDVDAGVCSGRSGMESLSHLDTKMMLLSVFDLEMPSSGYL
jgi:hypothetical protein